MRTATPTEQGPVQPAPTSGPWAAASFPLGRWAGVPVRAHWSVLATVVLFAVVLSTQTLPALRPGGDPVLCWLTGSVTALFLFVTLLLHELSHAVVARHYGVGVRGITLWMLGGATQLEGEPPTPRADAAVAAAALSAQVGRGLGWSLVVIGFLEVLAGRYDGFWLALVGWFVAEAAGAERHAASMQRLGALTAADVMGPTPVVPSWWTVEQLIDNISFEDAGHPVVALTDFDNRLVGTTTIAALATVPSSRRATMRLRDARTARRTVTVPPGRPLADLLRSSRTGDVAVVVDDAGRILGSITDADLRRADALSRLGWRGAGADHERS